MCLFQHLVILGLHRHSNHHMCFTAVNPMSPVDKMDALKGKNFDKLKRLNSLPNVN